MLKTVLLVGGMISGTVLANLLMKTGAMAQGMQLFGFGPVLNLRVFAGFSFYAVAAGFYIMLLRTIPLNVAQAFAAAQFIAIIVAAHFVLGEAVGLVRWLGIGLIASGIFLVGYSTR